MTAFRKFLFDTDFSVHLAPEPEPAVDGDAAASDAEGTEGEAEPVEEAPPTFSAEEVAAARAEGFAAGKAEGVREAADTVEREIADTLSAIGHRLPELFTAQAQTAEQLHAGGMAVIRAFARKAFPLLGERSGLDEIERLADEVLQRLRPDARVVFTVAESLRDALRERLAATTAAKGQTLALHIAGDAEIEAGDCRIEWDGGGAERQLGALLAEIDGIIERNIGGLLGDAGEGGETGPTAVEAVSAAGEDAVPTADGSADDESPQAG